MYTYVRFICYTLTLHSRHYSYRSLLTSNNTPLCSSVKYSIDYRVRIPLPDVVYIVNPRYESIRETRRFPSHAYRIFERDQANREASVSDTVDTDEANAPLFGIAKFVHTSIPRDIFMRRRFFLRKHSLNWSSRRISSELPSRISYAGLRSRSYSEPPESRSPN